jgi:thiol-disulfide isomerase/thioredoxin
VANVRQWFKVAVAAVVFVCGHAEAEVDILDYRLRDLLSSDAMELDVFRGGVSVLMFFEPDCPYCFRQARVLNQLQRECPDLHPVAIGLNGDRRALQKEAGRMRAEFPVLEIDERLQSDLGKVEATPLMLVGDRSGMLVTWLHGLQSAAVLRSLPQRRLRRPSLALVRESNRTYLFRASLRGRFGVTVNPRSLELASGL